MAEIRNIIFDIGWVLLHLRTEPLLDLLTRRGLQHNGLEDVATRIAIEAHESGRLDGGGLLTNITALVPGRLTIQEAHGAWLDMFDPQFEMIALAQRLSNEYRVFLLSNIGELHWSHISAAYGVHRIGQDYLQSYVAGVMKPHAEIYRQAESRFALQVEQTVFIDDRVDNIAAARARGWRGIVHANVVDTVTALQALHVRTE